MGNVRNIDIHVRLRGTDAVKKGMKDMSGSFNTAKLGWAAVAAAIAKGGKEIVKWLKEDVTQAIDFESALAGVAKTTNFTKVGLQNFANQIMALSNEIPITAVELANLAEIAGQLGINENNLLDFVEVVAAMGVSTNMSADEAATGLARLSNIFQTSADDYSKMGSAIVDLGNNFATTEAEILDMALRMAGMGAVVGASEADVLGYSAALSALGIEAAAGGSSMQKLFQTFEMAAKTDAKISGLAEVSGLLNDEFKTMWEHSPSTVINKFLNGLKELEDGGTSAVSVLDDIGIKEVRLIRTILGLANAGDLVNRSIEMSNAAWNDNAALMTEATKRYETTASRMQIAQNKIDNAEIAIGEWFKETQATNKNTIGDIAFALTEAAREIDLEKVIKETYAQFEAQTDVINDNAQAARNMVSALEALGDPALLDTEGKKKYAATLQALSTMMPQVEQMWNKETLAISGGTAAITEYINATQRLSTAEAKRTMNLEAADAYMIVERSVEAKRAELAAAEADLQREQEEMAAFLKALELGEINLSGSELEEATNERSAAYNEAQVAVNNLNKEIAEGEAILSEYAYVVADYESTAEEVVSAAAAYANATAGVNDAQQSAITGLTYLDDQLTALIESYYEAKSAIRETIDAAVSGFEKIEIPEIETPETKIEGLESQLEFLESYRDVIAKAKEMGVDSSIIAQFANGTVEGYTALASIVSGTEEDVETINQKLAEVTAAKDALATDIAATVTDLESSASDIITLAEDMVTGTDVSDAMYSAGASDVQSLIDGINSKISSLRIAVNTVNAITSTMGGSSSSGTDTNGSHAAGLGYVPHDGYIAQLHRGEMVLTALEAKAYRAEQFTNYPVATPVGGSVSRNYNETINSTTRIGTAVFYENADVDELANKIADRNRRIARARGNY